MLFIILIVLPFLLSFIFATIILMNFFNKNKLKLTQFKLNLVNVFTIFFASLVLINSKFYFNNEISLEYYAANALSIIIQTSFIVFIIFFVRKYPEKTIFYKARK
jgi:hypothetical protein